MIRNILGISVLTLALILIRAVFKGKISKRIRYSLWLILPAYFVISLFWHIDIKVPVQDNTAAYSEAVTLLEHTEHTDNTVVNTVETPEAAERQIDTQPSSTNTEQAGISEVIKLIPGIINFITITALAASLLYNAGFIAYCRKKRIPSGLDSDCRLPVYRIGLSHAPFLLWNKIYLKDPPEKDNEEYYAVIHEYCHYKHGDHIWSAVRLILLILNWYNPLIWIAYFLSGHDCELACDEEVLRMVGYDKRMEYGKALISAYAARSHERYGIGFGLAFKGEDKMKMKDRIINLKSSEKNQTIFPALLAALLVITAAGCSLADLSPEETDTGLSVTDTGSAAEIEPASEDTEINLPGLDDGRYYIGLSTSLTDGNLADMDVTYQYRISKPLIEYTRNYNEAVYMVEAAQSLNTSGVAPNCSVTRYTDNDSSTDYYEVIISTIDLLIDELSTNSIGEGVLHISDNVRYHRIYGDDMKAQEDILSEDNIIDSHGTTVIDDTDHVFAVIDVTDDIITDIYLFEP